MIVVTNDSTGNSFFEANSAFGRTWSLARNYQGILRCLMYWLFTKMKVVVRVVDEKMIDDCGVLIVSVVLWLIYCEM